MTGVVIINKPKGITSFGVVARLRRILGEKKIGHSGTLDPMATGVMTVMLGGATRFCSLLPDSNKAYTGVFRLGVVTDTLDITGKVLETRPVAANFDDVLSASRAFKGEITQLPPMYSAVSVGGKRLYELAREGIEIEREERNALVYLFDITPGDAENEYKFYVECSGGTYIRSIVSDLGEALSCGAVLTELNRVKANGFTIEQAADLPDFDDEEGKEALRQKILPTDFALKKYPALTVTGAQAIRFHNGGELSLERLKDCGAAGYYRVYAPSGEFLGIGNNDGDSLKVERVFNEI